MNKAIGIIIILLILCGLNSPIINENNKVFASTSGKIKIAVFVAKSTSSIGFWGDRYYVESALLSYFPGIVYYDKLVEDDIALSGNYSLLIQRAWSSTYAIEDAVLNSSTPVIISGYYNYPFAKALGNNDTYYTLSSNGDLELVFNDLPYLPPSLKGKTFSIPSGASITVWATYNSSIATLVAYVRNTTCGVTYPALLTATINGRKVFVFTDQSWFKTIIGAKRLHELLIYLVWYILDLPYNMLFPVYPPKYLPLRMLLVRVDDYTGSTNITETKEIMDYMVDKIGKFYVATRPEISSQEHIDYIKELRDRGNIEIVMTLPIGDKNYSTAFNMIKEGKSEMLKKGLYALPMARDVVSFVPDGPDINSSHAIVLKENGFLVSQESLTDAPLTNRTSPWYPMTLIYTCYGTYNYVSASSLISYLNDIGAYGELGTEIWSAVESNTTMEEWKNVIDTISTGNFTLLFPIEFYGVYHQILSYNDTSTYITWTLNDDESITITPHGNFFMPIIVRLDGLFKPDVSPYVWYRDDDGDGQEETYALIFGTTTFAPIRGTEYQESIENLMLKYILSKTIGYSIKEHKIYAKNYSVVIKSVSYRYPKLETIVWAPSGTTITLMVYTPLEPKQVYAYYERLPEVVSRSKFDSATFDCWYYDSANKLLYIKVTAHSDVPMQVYYSAMGGELQPASLPIEYIMTILIIAVLIVGFLVRKIKD